MAAWPSRLLPALASALLVSLLMAGQPHGAQGKKMWEAVDRGKRGVIVDTTFDSAFKTVSPSACEVKAINMTHGTFAVSVAGVARRAIGGGVRTGASGVAGVQAGGQPGFTPVCERAGVGHTNTTFPNTTALIILLDAEPLTLG